MEQLKIINDQKIEIDNLKKDVLKLSRENINVNTQLFAQNTQLDNLKVKSSFLS